MCCVRPNENFFLYVADSMNENPIKANRYRKLHQLTISDELDFKQKLNELFKVGSEIFGLDLAILSRISGDEYRVVNAKSPGDSVSIGETFSLENTFCCITIKNAKPTCNLHVRDSSWNTHPCYEAFGLESYIGIPVYLNGELYGTLNFSSAKPRGKDFDEDDFEYLQSMGQWVSAELERNCRDERLKDKNTLLTAITKANESFIANDSATDLFNDLLKSWLDITESEYGFIGEIKYTEEGNRYLKTYAITDISWNKDTREFYKNNAPNGLEFFNLSTLFGEVIKSGKTVISNSPASDSRSGGLPDGHPDLNHFLGIPLLNGKEFVGMIGIANRPSGYDEDVLRFVDPLITTTTNIICAFRENKKRIQAEQELRQFKSTLDKTIDCVFMFSPDTLKFFYVNQGAMMQVGYSEQELMEMGPFDIKPDYNEQQFRDLIQPFLSRKIDSNTFETVHQNKNGDLIPVEIFLQFIAPKGERSRFVAIVRDISERIKVDRMKSDFISTVSHELRTPLTSIRGSLGLLEGTCMDEMTDQAKSLISVAHRNSKNLVLLINDILDMDKIVSGKLELNCTEHSVTDLLQRSIENNQGYAESHQVKLELIDKSENKDLSVDADRFYQIMANLISNACKFSPENDTVTIESKVDNEKISISVHDNGPGIPQAFHEKIFGKFTQADTSNNRTKGGTGLGLSITKALTERMGGRISFSCPANEGTTFTIEFDGSHLE